MSSDRGGRPVHRPSSDASGAIAGTPFSANRTDRGDIGGPSVSLGQLSSSSLSSSGFRAGGLGSALFQSPGQPVAGAGAASHAVEAELDAASSEARVERARRRINELANRFNPPGSASRPPSHASSSSMAGGMTPFGDIERPLDVHLMGASATIPEFGVEGAGPRSRATASPFVDHSVGLGLEPPLSASRTAAPLSSSQLGSSGVRPAGVPVFYEPFEQSIIRAVPELASLFRPSISERPSDGASLGLGPVPQSLQQQQQRQGPASSRYTAGAGGQSLASSARLPLAGGLRDSYVEPESIEHMFAAAVIQFANDQTSNMDARMDVAFQAFAESCQGFGIQSTNFLQRTDFEDEFAFWKLMQLWRRHVFLVSDLQAGSMPGGIDPAADPMSDALDPTIADSQNLDGRYQHLLRTNMHFRRLHYLVEWLESQAESQARYSLDSVSYGKTEAAIRSGTGIGAAAVVTELDYDAPTRQGRQYVEDDRLEDAALVADLWSLIRSGQIRKAVWVAQERKHLGRAVHLCGALLYDRATHQGNSRRDLWKRVCAEMAKHSNVTGGNEYERAWNAVFACLPELALPACKKGYYDVLWAYARSSLWNTFDREVVGMAAAEMDVAEVFEETSRHSLVAQHVKTSVGKATQRVLAQSGDFDAFVLRISAPYVADASGDQQQQHFDRVQQLRIAVHAALLFFFDDERHPTRIRLLSKYIAFLQDSGRLSLVATYCRFLPQSDQIAQYVAFLLRLDALGQEVSTAPSALRKVLVEAGMASGLQMDEITRQVVETIRSSSSSLAEKKIDALRWLTTRMMEEFADDRMPVVLSSGVATEILRQANALIREFVCKENDWKHAFVVAFEAVPEAVRRAIASHPLPAEGETHALVNEFQAWSVYLHALQQHNFLLTQVAAASGEGARQLVGLVDDVSASFEQVLRFPGGWMVDATVSRHLQPDLEEIRRSCLPSMLFLWVGMLRSTQRYIEARRLMQHAVMPTSLTRVCDLLSREERIALVREMQDMELSSLAR